MPETSLSRGRPYWVAPAAGLVIVVLAIFGFFAAATGEWDVLWGDVALISLIVLALRSS